MKKGSSEKAILARFVVMILALAGFVVYPMTQETTIPPEEKNNEENHLKAPSLRAKETEMADKKKQKQEEIRQKMQSSLLWLKSLSDYRSSLLLEMPGANLEDTAPYYLQRYLNYAQERLKFLATQESWDNEKSHLCLKQLGDAKESVSFSAWEKKIEEKRSYFQEVCQDVIPPQKPTTLDRKKRKDILIQAWFTYDIYVQPVVTAIRDMQ